MHLIIFCDPPVAKPGENAHGTQVVIAHYVSELSQLGHTVTVLTAELFGQVPSGQTPYEHLSNILDTTSFDCIHVATQGQLGLLGRRYCVARKIDFTAAYHSQYPEWLHERHNIPIELGYAYICWFLKAARCTIVPTPSMARRLTERGVKNAVACLHGVDTERFCPDIASDTKFLDLPRPIWLYVGRIMVEKNIEAFLSLVMPGTKVVVGEGILRPELEAKYPDVHFAGVQVGDELPKFFRAADVFVFPSKTDTFGLVMLEALAAGLPVAAYPVTGPVDVITDEKVGCLKDDLAVAAQTALQCSPSDCRTFAEGHSWKAAAVKFLGFQSAARKASYRPVGSFVQWFERKGNFPLMLIELIVQKTEAMLFSSEHQ